MHRRGGQVLSDKSQSGVSWKSDDAVGMMHGLLRQVPLVKLDPWHDDRVGERVAAVYWETTCGRLTQCGRGCDTLPHCQMRPLTALTHRPNTAVRCIADTVAVKCFKLTLLLRQQLAATCSAYYASISDVERTPNILHYCAKLFCTLAASPVG